MGDFPSPRSSRRQGEAPESALAGVRALDAGRDPGDDKVHVDAAGCFREEGEPEV